MAKIEGLERVKRAIEQIVFRHLEQPNAVRGESVIVGYTAAYAIHVHENMEAAHGAAYNVKHAQYYKRGKRKGEVKIQRGPQQQAKFLEQPARELNNDGTLARIMTDAVRNGAKLQHAIYLAALQLQRASQLIVPVDTGNLRGSAFTAKE